MDENIQRFKEIVSKQVNNGLLPQSVQVEAIKAYALLLIAESMQKQ